MNKYVAFIRGINVGGNKKVSMSDLKTLLESLGFKNVKTLLNSGNVVFEAEKITADILEKELEKKFGFPINVILRSFESIKKLTESKPFEGIKITEQTRLYITFIKDKPASRLKIPYESPEKDFRILRVTNGEIISVLTLSPARGTTEAMNILEKEFGKKVTTRNWNTVVRLIAI